MARATITIQPHGRNADSTISRDEVVRVDDPVDACIYLLEIYSSHELINIGTRQDVTIAVCARCVAATVGYTGDISIDTSRPDGTPRKLLDVSRLAKLGWRSLTTLEDGIKSYRILQDSK